jgi:4-diphosphocytidyl-2-C-methyl-D-erythritol kinase
MTSLRVPAFAKVNLRLDVLGRRPDGYHELRTIFQSLSLHDTLDITRTRQPGIVLEVAGNANLSQAPAKDNLVWRAAAAICKALKLPGGVRIVLRKRIPVARGLGGGSSDAASTLAGILRLSGRRLPAATVLEIAASLGADVPFFLLGGRALGTSRGDEIYPLPDMPSRAVVVVSPQGIGVSTPDAYRWLKRGLTKRQTPHRIWGFCALCWSPQEGSLGNDFEEPVFRRHPRLAGIRRALLQQGAGEAALAGSGSAVFGVFRNPAYARRSARMFPEDEVFLCRTLSRKAHARALWGSSPPPWSK